MRATPSTSSSGHLPQVGDHVGGKYAVEALLGQGAMGAVFAARHVGTGKPVALKWMLADAVGHEGAVDRFLREAQAAGRIQHPHVVDVYDVGHDGGSPYLVMEHLRGRSLAEVLEGGGVTVDEVLDWSSDALRGLAAAHRAGVVHRDLKPDNIFICDGVDAHARRTAKVLDFGISRLQTDRDGHTTRLTRAGTILGTPYYMSPEQVEGRLDVDFRADVYAMGVVLYEAFTGRVPFDADNYHGLIIKIATEQAPRPRTLNPELHPALETVVVQAMLRDRERRYPSMDALLEALAGARGEMAQAASRSLPKTGRHSLQSGQHDASMGNGAPQSGIRLADPLDRPGRGGRGRWLLVSAVGLGLLATWWLSSRATHEAPARVPVAPDVAVSAPPAIEPIEPDPPTLPDPTPAQLAPAPPVLQPAEAPAAQARPTPTRARRRTPRAEAAAPSSAEPSVIRASGNSGVVSTEDF